MAWCSGYGSITSPSESFRCDGSESDLHLIRIPWKYWFSMKIRFLIKNSRNRKRCFVRKWPKFCPFQMIIPPFDASRRVESDGATGKSPNCLNRWISIFVSIEQKNKKWAQNRKNDQNKYLYRPFGMITRPIDRSRWEDSHGDIHLIWIDRKKSKTEKTEKKNK